MQNKILKEQSEFEVDYLLKYTIQYIPNTAATEVYEVEAYKMVIRITEDAYPGLFKIGDLPEQVFVLYAYETENRDWYLIHEHSGLAIISDGLNKRDLVDKFIRRLHRMGNARKFAEILSNQESVYRRVWVNFRALK